MYFVGINIGQDVTTVSRSPGYNGAPVSQIAIKPSNNNEGKKIVSAVCRRNNQWSLVYGKQDYKLEDIREGFKGRISKMIARDRESMREFAKLIFDAILINDPDLQYTSPDNKNFELGIACPFEWVREDSQVQQEYLDFFRYECGVPVEFCMKENDAIYYSRCERFNGDDAVFVIDIGTSLIDFSTYVKSRCVSQCCWGTNLGTHMIQDALMPHIYGFDKNRENVARLKQFKANNGLIDDVGAAISSLVCSAIEEFYTEERDSFKLRIAYEDLTCAWTGYPWDICIAYEVSKDEFNRIIANYMQSIHETLQNARIKLNTNGITPKRILLTGGAIGMPFIQEYAEQIFGVKVDIDPQPEWSISDGIALYMSYFSSRYMDTYINELRKGLVGISVLNVDYQKIDNAIINAINKIFPNDYGVNTHVDSQNNVRISSHMFLTNQDISKVLEDRIMNYAVEIFKSQLQVTTHHLFQIEWKK